MEKNPNPVNDAENQFWRVKPPGFSWSVQTRLSALKISLKMNTMIDQLKKKLKDKGLNLDAALRKFNFRETPAKYKALIKGVIHATPASDQREVLEWLEKVEAIRENDALSTAEKKKALGALKTSETVLNFIKSIADVLIEKVPFKNKDLIRTVLTGAALAASFTQIRLVKWAGVSVLVIKQLLPHILMLDKFDPVAAFIKRNLKAELQK
ncbi:MAG: hypothetical protein KF681_13430 [Bdellovibrionaceae bacterium]|nr:hypothetical protein [Pseudobdellovibrionaceae bacterium]